MKLKKTIGAWKCNFPTFSEIITDQQTNQPTKQLIDQQTDSSVYRVDEITLNKGRKRKRLKESARRKVVWGAKQAGISVGKDTAQSN